MGKYSDYKTHVTKSVKNCLENKSCQPILFIGSGFSRRYLKAPGWDELLTKIAEKCPLIDRDYAYYQQIHNSPIEIGSVFAEKFREWAWSTEGRKHFPEELFAQKYKSDIYIKYKVSEYLKSILKNNFYDSIDNDYKKELDAIKQIQPHAIITTNYDELIEHIFPEYEPIIGQRILQANTFCIGELFKIHGSISEPDGLILTKRDYDEFREKKKYLSAKLLTFFAEHPLLFVGYSASDPNIQAILSDIDEILGGENSLVSNIFILEWKREIKEEEYPQRDRSIILEDNKTIRVSSIVASNFKWVFNSFVNDKAIGNIKTKVLRTFLARTYDLVRYDLPKKKVEIDYQTLEHAVDSDGEEMAKILGITIVKDLDKINIMFPYSITDVAKTLGYNHWNNALKLIEKVAAEKGKDIKTSDNKYHVKLKTGNSEKSIARRYSQAAVDLLMKVKDGKVYELEL